jgi:hypothetical protein
MNFLKPTLWKLLIAALLCIPFFYLLSFAFGILNFYCVPYSGHSLQAVYDKSGNITNVKTVQSPQPQLPCGFISTLLVQMPFLWLGIIALLAIVLAYTSASTITKLYSMYMKQRAVLEEQEKQKRTSATSENSVE